jgi:antitoxin component YwqK of YwqJK toxin-antitoxin module
MKSFFYIIFLCLFFVSCTQKTIVLTEDQLPQDVFYQKDALKRFNGSCLIYYTGTKNIKEEMCFDNGILNGTYISYYKKGTIKRKGNYKNGYLNGPWVMFDEKGTQLYEVEYKKDTLSGNYKIWYSTGVPKVTGLYYQNKKSGKWNYYDETGSIIKSENL